MHVSRSDDLSSHVSSISLQHLPRLSSAVPPREGRRRRRLAAALLFLAPSVSHADPVPLGPPVRLSAPQRLIPAPSPVDAGAQPAPDQPVGDRQAAPGPASSGAIEADNLPPIAADWAGPLTEAQGGFPAGMWTGTPRALVTAALPRLSPTTSPGLQDLSRRLLLTNAMLPADWTHAAGGGSAPDPNASDPNPPDSSSADSSAINSSQDDFLDLRVDRLIAAGRFEDASNLLALAPSRGDGEPLERHRVELAFLGNDRNAACGRVTDDVKKYQSPWWSRALVACQALSGDSAKAALGLELLREQKAPRDDAFDALIGGLSGSKPKIDRLSEPSALHVALLAANKLSLPADAFAKASPALLRAWAGAEGAPPAQRLAAAERAAAFGAIPIDQLRALYPKIDFSPEERSNALTRAAAEKDGRANALFYLAAQAETTGEARAELLQGMLAAARRSGGAVLAARIAEPLVGELQPSSELAWFAGDAARILLVTGHTAEAQLWLAKADPATARDCFILTRLALGANGPAWDPDLLASEVREILKSDDEAAAQRAATGLGLLAALGEPVGPAQWAELLGRQPLTALDLPGAPIWFDLPEAAAGKRLGETVLLAAVTAGAADHLAVQAERLQPAIAGLRAVGLEPAARQLAVEAALGAGL